MDLVPTFAGSARGILEQVPTLGCGGSWVMVAHVGGRRLPLLGVVDLYGEIGYDGGRA